MKKKNISFAERAKKIVKKYKRADWDPIEQAALESSLNKLQEEQELYKQTNQIDEFSPEQMACGGKMYANGGYPNLVHSPQMGTEGFPIETAPIVEGTPLMGGNKLTYSPELSDTGNLSPELSSEYSPYNTSIAPSLISGATSTIGNLLLAKNTPKSPRLDLPRLAPTEVSLERGRQAATREASKGSSRARYAVKRGSRSRGEYLSNRAVAEAAISGNLGETLNKSYQEEALINANMKAGMNRANAEIAAREQMFNAQQSIRDTETKNKYLSAAAEAIPQTVRDINAIQKQDDLINLLGDDYGLYTRRDPNAKWYQRRKSPVVKYRGK